ncbi:hypothetical protein LAZ67_12000947 [Cordylochernes scorpioides]|uniref:Uncharacterized protein n=1 Tax=Cordylochernes scorpioides TaxID=51811 RepID=A0ABY6L100_9ARAC|nr:hypothetical protein LAZ67_12000947 [Cordylochernes scorpioides]
MCCALADVADKLLPSFYRRKSTWDLPSKPHWPGRSAPRDDYAASHHPNCPPYVRALTSTKPSYQHRLVVAPTLRPFRAQRESNSAQHSASVQQSYVACGSNDLSTSSAGYWVFSQEAPQEAEDIEEEAELQGAGEVNL